MVKNRVCISDDEITKQISSARIE